MKTKEEIKKIWQMKKAELINEKASVDKNHNLSRFEISSKKSENSSRINKFRKSRARILTRLNQLNGDQDER